MHQKIYRRRFILKTIIRITLILLLTQTLFAQTPKHEVRAVWLTTIGGIDWPHSYSPTQQRQEMIAILDQLQRANINTVEDLVNKTAGDMMKVRNLGKKSLDEVLKKLEDMGLSLKNDVEDI